MDPEAAYELITRDLQEVLGGEIVKKILTDGERHVKCYWGAFGHCLHNSRILRLDRQCC